MKIFTLVLLLLTYVQVACAGMKLEAVYPYHLEKKGIEIVYEESTVPLYVNIVNFGNDAPVETEVKITLPEGFKPVVDNKWQAKTIGDKTIVTTKWMKLKSIILSEERQSHRIICSMIPFIFIQKRQIHRKRR